MSWPLYLEARNHDHLSQRWYRNPAFYADWFLRPVSFASEDVEGFVFWEGNLAPFKSCL